MPKQTRGLDVTGLTLALNGRHTYSQTVTATTSTANATAFVGGSLLQIQPDTACYVTVGASGVTAAAASGLRLEANEKYMLVLGESDTHVAVLPVTGTSVVKFFLLG
jgi:hypothetical protein